jgi:hypothetical protein
VELNLKTEYVVLVNYIFRQSWEDYITLYRLGY